jgi:hypothetical protein
MALPRIRKCMHGTAASILLFCLLALPSLAQDQQQIGRLKQREITLEQQIRELQRQLEGLRKELYRATVRPVPSPIPDELRGNEHIQYGFPGGQGTILDKQFFVILDT